MDYKSFNRTELVIFIAILFLWWIAYMTVCGALFVGVECCGGLVTGYFNLGKDSETISLWLAVIAFSLATIFLCRWDSRRHFTKRSAEAAVAYYRRRRSNDA